MVLVFFILKNLELELGTMTLFSRRVESPSPSVQLLSCLFYADMSAILGAVSCQSSSELLQPGGNNTNPPQLLTSSVPLLNVTSHPLLSRCRHRYLFSRFPSLPTLLLSTYRHHFFFDGVTARLFRSSHYPYSPSSGSLFVWSWECCFFIHSVSSFFE